MASRKAAQAALAQAASRAGVSASAPRAAATATSTAWVAALLALAIAAAYANSLRIGFYFDDWHVIEQNPAIRSLVNVPRFFVDPASTSVLNENRELRPLLMATFAANYAISGVATWSYHVVNLLLHWIAVLLIFRIVRDHLWLGEEAVPIAAAAALIVAVHPLNTEPVDYVSARSALLTAVFYLGAFDAGVRRRRALCALLFTCALLTKAIAVTLPVMLVGYAWLGRDRDPEGSRGLVSAGWLATLVAIAAAAVVYRVLLVPARAFEASRQVGVTPWTYFITEWSAYLYYLRLFVWPNALVADRVDYPYAHSLLEPQAWASLLPLLVIAAVAWRARRRAPALSFAIFWYFVSLAAESTFFPLAEPVNEHRPYLAMLGLGTAAAWIVWRASRRLAGRVAPQVFAVAIASIALALGTAAHARNETWRDDYTLWQDAVHKAPRNPRAWLNLGHAAMARRQNEEALRALLRAHELSPCYAYVQMNLSALFATMGRLDDSLHWADEGTRCNPAFAMAHQYRGAALERVGRLDDALQEYRQATAIDPEFEEVWVAQGNLLERRGDWSAAAAAFVRALQANPSNADAAMRAALLYQHRLGDPARAIALYDAVLRLVPTHYGAHYQIATALLAEGRVDEARRAWQEFEPMALAIGDRASLDGAPAALRDAAGAPRQKSEP